MSEACKDCLRRSWLLRAMSKSLEFGASDRRGLLELLALGDEQLIRAIGDERRREFRARYARFTPREIPMAAGVESICRHHPDYPRALAGDEGPRMLYVAGAAERLQELDAQPVVAIVGSRRATDYGMEMARSLARGLAASGVRVAASLSDGIAVAAQAGALEVDGKTLTVMESGLSVSCATRRRALYERLREKSCVVAELPCDFEARRSSWCFTARERVVVGAAQLTIVVEADESQLELLGAHIAKRLGRGVAAVPGRVTSPVSRGTHTLLKNGAALIRGPADVLELLGRANVLPRRNGAPRETQARSRQSTIRASQAEKLEPRLLATLEQVGAGRDTPAKLTADSADAGEVLLALSELEVMGLLGRGDGGRYVPRESLVGVAPL
jgi:DNA processing protein